MLEIVSIESRFGGKCPFGNVSGYAVITRGKHLGVHGKTCRQSFFYHMLVGISNRALK